MPPDEQLDDVASRTRFATMLIERLAAAGETGTLNYSEVDFTISCPESQRKSMLHNAFAEYLASDEEGREKVVRVFLSTWFTSLMELPRELDLAKPDLLVSVRDRSYFEIDVPLDTGETRRSRRVLYEVLADTLAVAPVYDLPTAIRSLGSDDLERWNISLPEAIDLGVKNLDATTDRYTKIGDVYAFAFGDGHDASRLLLVDRIASFDMLGEPIAMLPQRDLLLFAGSHDDTALSQMLDICDEALDHQRRITGRAFQLVAGAWQPWLPAVEHPLHGRFAKLAVQSSAEEHALHRELLSRQFERESIDQFIATFHAVQQHETGQVHSFAIWSADVDTLLPKVDRLLLVAEMPRDKPQVVAAATWDVVKREAGHLMHAEGLYPERYRVMDFPDAEEIARIGLADWAAALGN